MQLIILQPSRIFISNLPSFWEWLRNTHLRRRDPKLSGRMGKHLFSKQTQSSEELREGTSVGSEAAAWRAVQTHRHQELLHAHMSLISALLGASQLQQKDGESRQAHGYNKLLQVKVAVLSYRQPLKHRCACLLLFVWILLGCFLKALNRL